MGLQSRCVRQGAFAGSDYPHRAGTSHHQRQPKHSYLQKQLRKLGQRGKERCGRRANERAEVANQMRFVTVATIHRNSGQRFWCLLARNRQTLIAAHADARPESAYSTASTPAFSCRALQQDAASERSEQ